MSQSHLRSEKRTEQKEEWASQKEVFCFHRQTDGDILCPSLSMMLLLRLVKVHMTRKASENDALLTGEKSMRCTSS